MSSVNKDYKKIKEEDVDKTTLKTEVKPTVDHHVKKNSEFEVINQDPYLKPYESKIKERVDRFEK
jgi:hypothetical protein